MIEPIKSFRKEKAVYEFTLHSFVLEDREDFSYNGDMFRW